MADNIKTRLKNSEVQTAQLNINIDKLSKVIEQSLDIMTALKAELQKLRTEVGPEDE